MSSQLDFDSDVLVVGSGPAGLALALALLKNGIRVRVIEKDEQHHHGERGSGVVPRTLEVEHVLGVVDEVIKTSIPMRTMAVFDHNEPHKIINEITVGEEAAVTPAFPYMRWVIIGQWRHQLILREAVEKLGGSVELGTALLPDGIQQDDDGVTVKLQKLTAREGPSEETARFKFVVGADGARSAVRKAAGMNFIGETRTEMLIYLADALVDGVPVDDHYGFYHWGEQGEDSLLIRSTLEKGVFQLYFIGSEEMINRLNSEKSMSAIQKEVERISKRTDIKIRDLIYQASWRPNLRIAETFKKGRVFVAGDAAHTHAPTGGQGLNSSFIDSVNLGWKIALAVKDLASTTLLESYGNERIPVIAEMLKITTELYKLTFSPEARQAIQSASEASSNGETKSNMERAYHRDRKLFQLDVNYRWSNVVCDERFETAKDAVERNAYGSIEQDVRAGDRAPDAPGLLCLRSATDFKPSRLFDVYSPAKHTALLFCGQTHKDHQTSLLQAIEALPSTTFQKVHIVPQGTEIDDASPYVVDYLLKDEQEYAFKHFGVPNDQFSLVIVRPDAMIGAFALSKAGVEKYVSAVFKH